MLIGFYMWLKVFHICAFTSWMAVLFYLPRLFVYHSLNLNNDEYIKIVKIQERRLMKGIGWPACIATIISGALLIASLYPEIFKGQYWLHGKLLFVFLLFIYHLYCARIIKKFARNDCNFSHVFFRFFNEFPTICLIVIVIFVVIKPL